MKADERFVYLYKNAKGKKRIGDIKRHAVLGCVPVYVCMFVCVPTYLHETIENKK